MGANIQLGQAAIEKELGHKGWGRDRGRRAKDWRIREE